MWTLGTEDASSEWTSATTTTVVHISAHSNSGQTNDLMRTVFTPEPQWVIIYWTAPKNSLSPFAYPPFQKKGRRALSISSSSPNFLHLLSFRLPSGTVYNSLIGTDSLQSALSSFHSGKYLYQQLLLSYRVASKMSIWVRLVVHLRQWLISPGVAVETLTSVVLSISLYWSPLKI